MTRSYTVTSMEVLPALEGYTNVVVKLNFTYGNTEASLQGYCSLTQPKGPFLPLDQISKEVSFSWLLDQCPNSTEEFDAQLDKKLAEKVNKPFVYTWENE